MRTVLRIAATAALLVMAAAVPAQAQAVPSADGHSIPVGAISDLGSVLTLADVGYDFATLLGQ
ncbi:hypothetical protein F4556_001373 [Kitasatospora gansuensis]|uniref:Uncharacterized protein n=1 Tax=Kitasatospora gansuensis TaxID=258050 RepID=A0A7W7WGB6_9ACTN|nr:hypothetical protein [Kitasatospora gansuensis]MBB4945838.1 hypothetical protein [Kitasatospora gansuensis]